jgi:hypothetical protein
MNTYCRDRSGATWRSSRLSKDINIFVPAPRIADSLHVRLREQERMAAALGSLAAGSVLQPEAE